MASSPTENQPPPAQPAAQPESTANKAQPLPLPEPPKDGNIIDLNVNGEGVKLDHLGPLVVNQDGTMSRISNWPEMSEIERENTLRILGKRNQLRLGKLREDAGASVGDSK